MRVRICGPNLRDQRKGSFHVHAETCSDLIKHARREPEYRNGWAIEAATQADIVNAVYEEIMDEHNEGVAWLKEHPEEELAQYPANLVPNTWRDYADDVHIFPCIDLPEEA